MGKKVPVADTTTTLDTGLGWIGLEAPPWEPAFAVLEGALQAIKGEKQSTVLPRCEGYELQGLVSQDIPKGKVVTHILMMHTSFLVGLQSWPIGKNFWLVS